MVEKILNFIFINNECEIRWGIIDLKFKYLVGCVRKIIGLRLVWLERILRVIVFVVGCLLGVNYKIVLFKV